MAYIFEHIRTQGFAPLHFDEHYARLSALARKLFLAPLAVESKELCTLIGEKLQNEGFSARNKNAVYVRYDSNGSVVIECVDTLYNEFSLRALRPQTFICRISGEILTENTSAKESALELNRTTSLISEQGVPMWVNEQGEMLAIDGAPVIAVFDNEIRFSRMGSGVEFDIAYSVAEEIGKFVSKESILLDEITRAKELLYIDHRGITAIESYESHHFMDITAAKIASKIVEKER